MNAVIITHTDCDGLCSAAIALMKYPDAKVIFTQPYALLPVLSWGEVQTASKVVILDIAHQKSSLDKLLELDRTKELIYIDHHPSSLELVGKLKNAFINVNLSASQLTAIYFQIPTVLAEIGAIGDKILIVSKGYSLFREAELLRQALTYDPFDDEFRLRVVHSLACGKLPSGIPEVVERAKKSVEFKDKLVELAMERVVHVNEFILIDVTDLSELFSGRVGTVATTLTIKYTKPVFIVSKTGDKLILTGRSCYNSSFDLSRIMKLFGGGGHKYAASATITREQYEKLPQILTNIWRSMYGRKNQGGTSFT